MKFTVTFTSNKGKPVEKDVKQVGLCLIDQARKKKWIDVEDVYSWIDRRSYCPSIEVGETGARSSKRFEHTNSLYVEVPKRSLNKFTYPQLQENPSSKETLKFVWEADNHAIEKAWFQAGCPLEWNPEEKPAAYWLNKEDLKLLHSMRKTLERCAEYYAQQLKETKE